jgi:hypothetical protein
VGTRTMWKPHYGCSRSWTTNLRPRFGAASASGSTRCCRQPKLDSRSSHFSQSSFGRRTSWRVGRSGMCLASPTTPRDQPNHCPAPHWSSDTDHGRPYVGTRTISSEHQSTDSRNTADIPVRRREGHTAGRTRYRPFSTAQANSNDLPPVAPTAHGEWQPNIGDAEHLLTRPTMSSCGSTETVAAGLLFLKKQD